MEWKSRLLLLLRKRRRRRRKKRRRRRRETEEWKNKGGARYFSTCVYWAVQEAAIIN
jgi:hypothetical protein